jgi:hypothetical protein
MAQTPNIVSRENYTDQQTIPPNNTASGWGYWDSLSVAPSAEAYGIGPAWIGGNQYWSDGSSWLSSGGTLARVSSSASGPNVATVDAATGVTAQIDPAAFGVVVLGGAIGGQINNGVSAAGKSFASNLDQSNPSDTYVSGTCDYSQIFGYDNIGNGLISIIIGAHNLIYTAADHGVVIGASSRIEAGSRNFVIGSLGKVTGGSQNAALGSYSATISTAGNNNTIVGGSSHTINNAVADGSLIVGGATHSITSGGDYNSIIGGAQCTLSGSAQSYSTIIGSYLSSATAGSLSAMLCGQNNTISSTGSGNSITNAFSSTISGAGNYAAVFGGYNNTITALHGTCVNGTGNTVSGAYGYTFGTNCTASGQGSVAFGAGSKADSHGMLSITGRNNSAVGDAQTDIINMSVQTTDATDRTAITTGSNGANVAAGAYCGEVYVVARKSDGSLASGFIIPFMFEKSGSTITVRKGQTRTETTILYDGLGITSANAPYITGASGYFTVTVQGLAATTVNWSCSVRMARVV